MIKQRLMIIDDKTEFLFIGTRKQLTEIDTSCSINVGERDIDPGLCARNLGVWFDSQKKKCFQLWSSLLAELRAIPSVTIFKPNLQTYLF
ncbi:unnamed protein product, partial [Pocillopora meandrina]